MGSCDWRTLICAQCGIEFRRRHDLKCCSYACAGKMRTRARDGVTRACSACGETKSLDQFGKDKRAADGCKGKCRLCEKAYMLAWQRAHRESLNIRNAAWAKANPEKKRACSARRDKGKRTAYARLEHVKARARAKKREEYARRRDEILARCKAWSKTNRHKRRAYASQPHMRLHSNVSRAIRAAIRLNKSGRGWESLVGYSRADLVAHLERLFTEGMSWENYGAWEIDHKRPRSSFSFTTAEDQQFKECWALTNLQPLWMPDNRRKHARYEAAA